MLAEYGVAWFEEPLSPDHFDDFLELRRLSPVPISTGEALTRRQSFLRFITAGAVDIVQPDSTKVRGLSEARRIAWAALDHGVEFIPHGWNTAVGVAADLHLLAALPTARFVEFQVGSPYISTASSLRRSNSTPKDVSRFRAEPGSGSSLIETQSRVWRSSGRRRRPPDP